MLNGVFPTAVPVFVWFGDLAIQTATSNGTTLLVDSPAVPFISRQTVVDVVVKFSTSQTHELTLVDAFTFTVGNIVTAPTTTVGGGSGGGGGGGSGGSAGGSTPTMTTTPTAPGTPTTTVPASPPGTPTLTPPSTTTVPSNLTGCHNNNGSRNDGSSRAGNARTHRWRSQFVHSDVGRGCGPRCSCLAEHGVCCCSVLTRSKTQLGPVRSGANGTD